jgi:LysM repeat protein
VAVRGWVSILICGLVLAVTSASWAKGGGEVRVHTVYRGQRLASIAKRYNVTVDAIAHANNLAKKRLIRPGQKLIIPDRKDQDGREARQLFDSGYLDQGAKQSRPKPSKPKAEKPRGKPQPHRGPRVHRVYKGQRLGSIAKRYHVSVSALCAANGIDRKTPIHPGLELVIPASDDSDGTRASQRRAELLRHHEDEATPKRTPRRAKRSRRGRSWQKYVKAPWRRGYITLQGFDESWKGYVIGPGNRVLGGAKRAVGRVFKAGRLRSGVNTRLIGLLARVSDTFGGRPIRVVSGYRATSYSRESRHKLGRAVDFSIPGVPNDVLRDYLLTLPNVGVGYYPNSTFVHFDVRAHKTYWVDYSGPGEPPRYGEIKRLK